MLDVDLLQASDVFDEAEARKLAMFAFGKSVAAGKSPTADMQTRCAPGKQRLKSPRNAALVTHVAASRVSGRSRELIDDKDWERSRIAKAIYALPHPHPMAISWRHHHDKSVRDVAAEGLRNLMMVDFMGRHKSTIETAHYAGTVFVRSGGVRDPWLLDRWFMSYSAWRNSSQRKVWEEVQRIILAKELDALRALMTKDGLLV